MILPDSLPIAICPSPEPTWNSKIGTSKPTRAVLFRSFAIRAATRAGSPSPTSTTPEVAVAVDGRGHRPVAPHLLQDRRRRAWLALDRLVLRRLREPAEQDHDRGHAEQDAQRDQEHRRPGQQAGHHQHRDDGDARAEGDRQGLLIALVDQAGDHPHLLQPPGILQVLSAVLVNHRISLP
jgi:hypothetical protein